MEPWILKEINVKKEINNYWDCLYLRKETQGYVPKFICLCYDLL